MRWYIWSLFVFLVATVFVCTPLLKDPYRNVVDDYDGVFITWSMNWASYALTHTPTQLYDAPIFFPLKQTVTFSDPMVTAGLMATPFILATHEPLVAHTVVIFMSYVLMGWFTTLFVFELTKSRVLAVTAGLYATFGSYHTMYMGHLHTFMLQWIPLSFLAWRRYVLEKRLRWLWIWAGSFVFTAINSPFSGMLFLAAQGIWMFDRTLYRFIAKHWKDIIIPIGISFLCVVVFYLPYVQSATLYNSARSIRDAAHFALSFNELVGSSRGFTIGVVLCIAVLIAKLRGRRLWHEKFGGMLGGILGVIIIAGVLALGPVLKWNQETVKIPFPIPLPYSVAYYTIPGMNAFRAPARWVILASFLSVIGAAVAVKSPREKTLLTLALFVLLLIEKPWNYPVYTLHNRIERDPVFSWLQEYQLQPVVFLPPSIYAMPNGARSEVLRMLDTLPGKQPVQLYNGYSGYAPQERIDALISLATSFPSEKTLQILQRANVHTIVVEKKYYTAEQIDEIAQILRTRFENDRYVVGDISSSN